MRVPGSGRARDPLQRRGGRRARRRGDCARGRRASGPPPACDAPLRARLAVPVGAQPSNCIQRLHLGLAGPWASAESCCASAKLPGFLIDVVQLGTECRTASAPAEQSITPVRGSSCKHVLSHAHSVESTKASVSIACIACSELALFGRDTDPSPLQAHAQPHAGRRQGRGLPRPSSACPRRDRE